MLQFDEDKTMQRVRAMRERSEEKLVQSFSKKHGVGYVDLSTVSVNTDALKLIPEDRAKIAKMAAFNMIGRKLAIAVRSPLIPQVQIELDNLSQKGYSYNLFMCSESSLAKAWSRYGDISYAVKTERGVIDLSSADLQDVLESIDTLEEAKDILKQALDSKQAYRVSKVIELTLYSAHALGASDVHIEPGEFDARVRFRLDGILTNIVTIDATIYNKIRNRIKLTSGMKLNVSANAQDGRFSIKMAEREIEIRASALPDAYGESIVLRLLNPDAISVPVEDLGIEPKLLEILNKEIHKPNGMILNTGPTGSGKSTTLFAFLKKIRSPEIKIITIENPIEYHVAGITQTQINKKKGYDFLAGLRAAMRQDPDVIMVGEIRDSETANTAANAALTGHLVLSTLHTNSAAGTFARLLDLGVNPKTLAVAMNVSLAQRLVRVLCVHCKKQVPVSENKFVEYINRILPTIDKEKYLQDVDLDHTYDAVGCPKCNNTGYKGRLAVLEAILMDKEVEQLLKTSPSERDINEGSKHQGILRMVQDGVVKVMRGQTTMDELNRVLDLDEEI